MKKQILTKKSPAPIGSYNQAVKDGNMIFISGQIAIESKTNKLVLDSIEEQTKQVMENLKAILEEANCTFNDVVKVSVFMTDISFFEKINKVYTSYLNNCKILPAREAIQVAGLPKRVNVEMSAIAIKH